MEPRIRLRLVLAVLFAVPACHRDAPPAGGPCATSEFPVPGVKDKPRVPLIRDQIPSAVLDAALAAHLEGLGHMERYEYDKAVQAFRAVTSLLRAGSPARSTWRSPC